MARRRAPAGAAEGSIPPASKPFEREAAPELLARLADLDSDQLRLQWRNHLGGSAPAHLPRWLLTRLLAYRLQAVALGDLDPSVRRAVLAAKHPDGYARFEGRAPQTRNGLDLKAGALLVREWQGKLERVMILEQGFAWNGQTFGSLSQIAKAMTGTTWNGHRFFGLRQGKATAGKGRRKEAGARGKSRPGPEAASVLDPARGARS